MCEEEEGLYQKQVEQEKIARSREFYMNAQSNAMFYFSNSEAKNTSRWRGLLTDIDGGRVRVFADNIASYSQRGHGITIVGASGTGKSTLAAALAVHLWASHETERGAEAARRIFSMMSCYEIIETMQASNGTFRIFSKVLLVDHLQRAGSEIRRAAFEAVILARGDMPTWFIVNPDHLPGEKLREAYPGLASRFAKNLLVRTVGKDFRIQEQMMFVAELDGAVLPKQS